MVIARLLGLFHTTAAERELEQEVRAHLEMLVEEGIGRGLSPGEARRQALLRLGNPAVIRENFWQQARLPRVESIWQDVRYAIRTMRHAPVFTAVAVLSLALGIGANTAIFTVIDALMLKTLPVRAPEQLVEVARTPENDDFTYSLWQETRKQQDVLSGMFAYGEEKFDLATGGQRQPAAGLWVSGDYFETLGVRPILGRTFTANDDERGAQPVAVLSSGFWQRQYGADANIVGRVIRLDGYPFRIIGVTPPEFSGLDVGQRFDVAVPIGSEPLFHPNRPWLDGRWTWWLNVGGRLKPGISFAQANARFGTLAQSVWSAALPGDATAEDRARWITRPLILLPLANGFSYFRSQYSRALVLLMWMVVLVLLIACANLASMLLARSTTRQREIAVRLALGASRARLIQQLLTESLMLSLFGAAVGVLIAMRASAALVAAISSSRDPLYLGLSLDGRVLAFTVAIAVLTGILFGLAPAFRAAHIAPYGALKQAGSSFGGGRNWFVGRALVATQVAFSLLLLIGAGLFARSFYRLVNQDMGFRDRGVLLIEPDLRSLQYKPERKEALAQDLLAQFRAIPGVRSAAFSQETPISGGTTQWDVLVRAPGIPERKLHAYVNLVSRNFFETLGTPLLSGRDFIDADGKNAPRVGIINEAAARLYYPGLNPIGQIYWQYNYSVKDRPKSPVQVIGVVKDAKYRRLRDEAPATVYQPLEQSLTPVEYGSFELNFDGPLADVVSRVKQAAQAVDPHLGFEFHLFSDQVRESVLRERLLAVLAGFFAALALLLAAIGLYGLMSYVTQQRTAEIGVRMALGARRADIVGMVLRDVAVLIAIGVALGVPASFAATRIVKTMLYGVGVSDPLTLIAAIVLMTTTGGLAAFLPARRAARVDPNVALRCE
jgi:predicted permease